jgi:hypothetical protein
MSAIGSLISLQKKDATVAQSAFIEEYRPVARLYECMDDRWVNKATEQSNSLKEVAERQVLIQGQC